MSRKQERGKNENQKGMKRKANQNRGVERGLGAETTQLKFFLED